MSLKTKYEKEEKLQFHVGGVTHPYKIKRDDLGWYLHHCGLETNDVILEELGVKKKERYVFISNIVGYEISAGIFPYVKTLEDLCVVIDVINSFIEKKTSLLPDSESTITFRLSIEDLLSESSSTTTTYITKSINESKSKPNGRIIEVQRQAPSVRSGQGPRGSTISGRTRQVATRSGHISYKEIACPA